MTVRPAASQRQVKCARCGAPFDCGAGSDRCWCAEETYRVPMPASGQDCLCPSCLRVHAGQLAASAPR